LQRVEVWECRNNIGLAQQWLIALSNRLASHALPERAKRVHLIHILDTEVVSSRWESGMQFLICSSLFVAPVIGPDVSGYGELVEHRLLWMRACAEQIFKELLGFCLRDYAKPDSIDEITCVQGYSAASKDPPLWNKVVGLVEVSSAIHATWSIGAPRDIDAHAFGAVGNSPPSLEVDDAEHLARSIQSAKSRAVGVRTTAVRDRVAAISCSEILSILMAYGFVEPLPLIRDPLPSLSPFGHALIVAFGATIQAVRAPLLTVVVWVIAACLLLKCARSATGDVCIAWSWISGHLIVLAKRIRAHLGKTVKCLESTHSYRYAFPPATVIVVDGLDRLFGWLRHIAACFMPRRFARERIECVA
jgi:hypothetical protein